MSDANRVTIYGTERIYWARVDGRKERTNAVNPEELSILPFLRPQKPRCAGHFWCHVWSGKDGAPFSAQENTRTLKEPKYAY